MFWKLLAEALVQRRLTRGTNLVSSCANESQNQRNCLLFSHVIIQLKIFNTAKQRYIYSKQTKKSENKDTVIKFLLSCNIRSLCNTAHCNDRYVPTTGHRRQNTRITILINGSATTTPMFSIFTHALKFDCLFLTIFQSFHLLVSFIFDKLPPLPWINVSKDLLNHYLVHFSA